MNENKETPPFLNELSSQWMKTGMDLWGPMAKMWTDTVSALFRPKTGVVSPDQKDRLQSSFETSANTFMTLFSTMGQTGSTDTLFKGLSTLPQIWMKMAHTSLEAFTSLQRLWMEKAGRIHASTQAYQFENLDENVFQIWSEVYEKEVKPFIQVPQIGPARFYQERFNETLDAYNQFQTAAGEFLRLLYLPIEKSLVVYQKTLEQQVEKGEFPKSSKEFYQGWIKTLEGHYMTLFKSEEYAEIMGKVLEATEEYLIKKNRLVSDVFRLFSLPTQEEMDALYKDIYLMKKRIRALEKRSQTG